MPVQQVAHRLADPRRDVHAVGDVRDRDLLDRALRPQPVPHLARHLAVSRAHAVGDPRRAQRELRDAERLAVVLRVRAAAPDERPDVEPELLGHAGELLGRLLRRVRVVAGRDGGVRGEDRAAADRLERLLHRLPGLERRPRQLQAGERRMPLVEVHDARVDAERVERPHAADAQQQVLAEPDVPVADVQPRGDPAVGEVVLRPVGVEQQQRHAADVDAPDLGDEVAAAERHPHGDRLAVVARHERTGHAVRVGVDPVLVLPAGGVDPLAEVAVAVHQADGDERHAAVRALLEDVARQHAEAAGVDRERAVHGVLGAEERRRVLGRDRRLGRLGGQRGLDRVDQRGLPREEPGVLGQLGQPVGMGLLEQPHRVAGTRPPACRVDRLEQLRAAGRPRPAVVVGEARERPEGLGQARAERGGGRRQIGSTGLHERLC